MCGIYCSISFCRANSAENYKVCEELIKNRGPDWHSCHEEIYGEKTLKFAASVLWLQGLNITKQPVSDEKSTLIYNGDVYDDGLTCENERLILGDTSLFKNHLDSSSNILETLSRIHGPYAFVYYRTGQQEVYFSRDHYGRKSLLLGFLENGEIVISSVASKQFGKCLELPAIGCYCYSLNTGEVTLFPWKRRCQTNYEQHLERLQRFLPKFKLSNESCCQGSLSQSGPSNEEEELIARLKLVDFDEGMGLLLQRPDWSQRVSDLTRALSESVRRRVTLQPPEDPKGGANSRPLSVLFSGGVDCTILALLADDYTPPGAEIRLVNVSFAENVGFNSPDRVTGRASLEELRTLRPERRWEFFEVNVGSEELQIERQRRVRHLLHPLDTVLDDSLGCVLWFGARGASPGSKVVLTGSGADELFGGYTKHRAALKRSGWPGLRATLLQDWDQISTRNLGRDDRIISDHGRQLRLPYLDENVVNYVLKLDPWQKTLPIEGLLGSGTGEKLLLRALAYKLGLRASAGFKKRAMQFGSRIANRKEKGAQVSPRLL